MINFIRTVVQPWLINIGKALAEVGIVAAFSFVPAILSANQSATKADTTEPVFIPTLLSYVSKGQLVVFTAAILGTIIWQALPFWQPDRFVRTRSAILLLIIILAIFVTNIGGFDPSFKGGNESLFLTSVFTYLIALVTYLVLLVINHPPDIDFGASLKSESDALVEKYNEAQHG